MAITIETSNSKYFGKQSGALGTIRFSGSFLCEIAVEPRYVGSAPLSQFAYQEISF